MTEDHLTLLRGATILAAEVRHGALRLQLDAPRLDYPIVALSTEGDSLTLSDETAIPFGS